MRKVSLSQYKQNKLIEQFVAGVTARTASELVNVNKNTAAYYFHRLRLLIYQHSPHLEMFEGEIEVDESYLGGHRAATWTWCSRQNRRVRAFKAGRKGLYRGSTKHAICHTFADYSGKR